jgi:hypothetical protein
LVRAPALQAGGRPFEPGTAHCSFAGKAAAGCGGEYARVVPPQNVITRLEEVALGLGRLAEELENVYSEKPKNLLWWRQELLDIADELRQPRHSDSRQPHGPLV